MPSARLVTLTALAVMATPLAVALADSYPVRPIRFIVPFAVGGGNDIAARVVAERLSRTSGQTVVVENRSGSGGTVGVETAARSPADGYTVLIVSDSMVVAPHVFKTNVDPIKDLTPVVQISRQPMVLAVHPSLNVTSVVELTRAVQRESRMSYATAGKTSAQNIVAQWFAAIAGVKLDPIPYRGGGQAVNDLIAGHVMLASLGTTPLMPHYKAGTVRLLAQSTQVRSSTLPDVPTYQEAGMNGLVIEQWLGAFVPAGTPPDITVWLNAEINKALADPDIRERLAHSAQDAVGGSPEAFSSVVHDDYVKYGRLIKDLNITPE